MPKQTLDKYGKKLRTYLSHFGEVDFTQDSKQNQHGFNYVGIELIAKEQIVEELQKEVNSRLSIQNGIILQLDFHKWGEETKERFRYEARIISKKPLGEDAYIENLKTYVPQLGKAIKNATYNHNTCRSKVREIRQAKKEK
jgi:hypothetical protein